MGLRWPELVERSIIMNKLRQVAAAKPTNIIHMIPSGKAGGSRPAK
jgi:hypothetical protein